MHETASGNDKPGGQGRRMVNERNNEETERRCRGKRYTVSLMIVISLLLNWLLICSLVINLALWHVIIGANYRQKINKIKRDCTDFYVSCTFSKRSDIASHFLVELNNTMRCKCAHSFINSIWCQALIILLNFVAIANKRMVFDVFRIRYGTK